MPHEAHRVVAMIVGQDEDDVARLGFGHALDGQLVDGNRLAKRRPTKRGGIKDSDAIHDKMETAAKLQPGSGLCRWRLAV